MELWKYERLEQYSFIVHHSVYLRQGTMNVFWVTVNKALQEMFCQRRSSSEYF